MCIHIQAFLPQNERQVMQFHYRAMIRSSLYPSVNFKMIYMLGLHPHLRSRTQCFLGRIPLFSIDFCYVLKMKHISFRSLVIYGSFCETRSHISIDSIKTVKFLYTVFFFPKFLRIYINLNNALKRNLICTTQYSRLHLKHNSSSIKKRRKGL